MKPFVLPVADLLFRPGGRRPERLVAPLPGQLTVGRSVVPAGSVVEVETVLEWVTDGLLASGSLSAPWVGECRRCLGPVQGMLDVEFRELFEQSPREGESYRLGHDTVDMEPLVREALVLELPLAPVCDESCAGLCPTCGADLNKGACGCETETGDPRWAALDALRLDPPSGE
ncbi:MAG: YceD family protein [Acidimicrobiales bacterium]